MTSTGETLCYVDAQMGKSKATITALATRRSPPHGYPPQVSPRHE